MQNLPPCHGPVEVKISDNSCTIVTIIITDRLGLDKSRGNSFIRTVFPCTIPLRRSLLHFSVVLWRERKSLRDHVMRFAKLITYKIIVLLKKL